MNVERTILVSLGLIGALSAPWAAFAGTFSPPPNPGTYFFSGTCLSGCSGAATGTLVADSTLATSSFQFLNGPDTITFSAPLTALQSVSSVPTGPATVFIERGPQNTFVSNVSGSWSFASASPLRNFSGTNGTWSTSPIPEPATYALMLAGLVAVGALAWRKSAKTGT